MAERAGAALEKDLVVDDGGDLFDNIDDLLDFPDDGVLGGGWGRGSALLCSGALLPEESGSCFSGPDSVADDDLGAGLSIPTEDIPELDWLSSFVEDSFSAGSFGLEAAVEDRRGCHKDGRFRTSSPVSVLDSTSSTSSRKLAAPLLVPSIVVPSRARSKLPRRPATFPFGKPLSLVSPASSTDETDPHSSLRAHFLNFSNFSLEFDSNVELRQRKKIAKKTKKKQKLFVAAAASSEVAQPVRKCTHCEIQKTPQWRAGPMGPKTLCNACGVRYKSGRLFPEYRPAASPTFVPALHSNSHKKVLEMRDEMGQKDPAPVPQFVRKTSHWDGSANGGHQEIFVN